MRSVNSPTTEHSRPKRNRMFRRPFFDASSLSLRLSLLFLCLLSAPLAAQSGDGEPESPGVEVPPVVFEYDAARQRDIDVLLPEAEPLALPEIEAVLPVPEKMEVSSPEVPISPPTESGVGSVGEASFFSEGRIGVGTDNHLLGDISLYKRGEGPHFSVGFSHEGSDGYGEESSGSGYFHRKEDLTGSFDAEGERAGLGLQGGFTEQEKGLQDYADASSVIHRFSRASVDGSLALGSNLYAEAQTEAHYSSRVSAGEVDGGDSYSDTLYDAYIVPEASIRYETGWGELKTGGGYGYYRSAGEETFHSAEGYAEIGLFLSSLDITARGGAMWEEEEGNLFPFLLKIDGMAGDLFHYRLEGGYETRRYTYRELWSRYPLLDTAESLLLTHGWSGAAGMGGSLTELFDWTAGASYFAAENYPEPGSLDARDPEDGLFSIETGGVRLLEAEASLTFRPLSTLDLSFAWDGEMFGEVTRPEGQHRFSASLDVSSPGDRYGGEFSAAYSVEPISDLPVLETGGYYRLSEGVLLRVEWTDMLGPLVDDGRRIWGEYVEPGMQLRIMTEISL